MKKLFLSLVAMIIAAVSYAQNQNELVATLQHGDDLKMFYGSSALQSAVKEAQAEDIIVLTSGRFTGCEINKKLTIRGAGTFQTTLTDATRVPWNANARIECLTIDKLGNYSGYELGNVALVKVRIKTLNSYPWNSNSTAWFKNCIIDEFSSDIRSLGQTGNGLCYFVNCKVANLRTHCRMVMNNCTINESKIENLSRSRMSNSIIWYDGEDEIQGQLPSGAVASNCLAAGNYAGIFDGLAPEAKCFVVGMDVFEESNAENDLTEEAKTEYLGVDNTPVGIFGGQLPFNTTNPYPYISMMNVAPVTTADGKLSVEVEVKAAE